ncbi:MAG: RNA polymerase sigma factor [Actinobacteria bacterium]|nr:RNA polymerase sigma factor [Actinomycetota bacterium]
MRRQNESRAENSRELVSAELIERCKRGDRDAWNTLVQATHREVYTLCLRVLRDPDDAAEAAQDAYIKVWKGLNGFRGEAAFTTWLYRVASNAAISKQRSRSRKQSFEAGGDDELVAGLAAPDSTENAAGARVELQAVERALATLPEHYRSAVLLRDVYGLTIAEIASQLKISETAAKVRVHRGRARLKEIVWPSGARR